MYCIVSTQVSYFALVQGRFDVYEAQIDDAAKLMKRVGWSST